MSNSGHIEKSINFDTVAHFYDDYVKSDMDIDFFLKVTEGHDEILELMCGTGRVSIPLLQRGRKLTCVDYSRGMLREFEKKLAILDLHADLIEMDVCELDLGRTFDLIFIPFHSFSEICSVEQQLKAITAINDHLHEGGTFVLTLQNPARRSQVADGQRRRLGTFPLGENSLTIDVMNSLNEGTDTVEGIQHFEIVDKNGQLIESEQLEIRFRLVSFPQVEALLSATDLKIESVFGDYDFGEFNENTSDFSLYVIRKTAT